MSPAKLPVTHRQPSVVGSYIGKGFAGSRRVVLSRVLNRFGLLALMAMGAALAAIDGPSSMVRGGDPEDSLQSLVQQDPDNPSHWIGLGQFALKSNQDDLAKGYFDEAIKLSKNTADPILRIGMLWLENGKVEQSLPYLIPNLARMTPGSMTQLEKALEDRNHPSAAILVLRQQASRIKGYSLESQRAGELAFQSRQYALCREILAPYVGSLDSASAETFLVANFYAGKPFNADNIQTASARSNSTRLKTLAALDQSLLGNFKAVHALMDPLGANVPAPVQHFIQAEELASEDKADEASDQFNQALGSAWPEFRVITTSELYKHYSITGNGYKADQLWDDIKGRDTLPALKEFLAYQLTLRGYEKQAHILYKGVYRSVPGRPAAIKALWDELVDDDPENLGQQISTLLAADPLDCEANQLAMRFNKARNLNHEVVHHGRNVVLYCYEVVDPYFDLATALLSLSKPDEARTYFAKYVRSGGDKTRIPTYMR